MGMYKMSAALDNGTGPAPVPAPAAIKPAAAKQALASIEPALSRFVAWLDTYGETSFDHQSFFAGPVGGRAKALYYARPFLGILAVAPMVFAEAFVPSARKLFWHRQRFPIADAHYAMGFALLARLNSDISYHGRAVHFLDALKKSVCPGYRHMGWGYPFDWVTRTGVMAANTPLITSTPYAYEAFEQVFAMDGNKAWLAEMLSAAEHAASEIPDREVTPDSATAGYNPDDPQGGVINASAYRAFLLISAGLRFSREDFLHLGRRNLNFVLQAQQADGSWPYSADDDRDFVDHFHTCFVLKALAKIEKLTGHEGCGAAIEQGVAYYVSHLFDDAGLPKPFSKAPRLTVYRQELYDYAECINLAVLLRGQYPALDSRLSSTLDDLLAQWQKPDGSFRSRRLLLGWDNVPMHRWAQAQLFRSLCLYQDAVAGPAGTGS